MKIHYKVVSSEPVCIPKTLMALEHIVHFTEACWLHKANLIPLGGEYS
jgi:hypothetical protein